MNRPENNNNAVAAHKHSSRHREEIHASKRCSCFLRCQTHPPSLIVEWIASEETARYPCCSQDAVIGSASTFPISDSFLKRMHATCF